MPLLTEMVKENCIGKFQILKNSLKLGVYLLRICYFRKNKKCTAPIPPPSTPFLKKRYQEAGDGEVVGKAFLKELS